MKLKTVIELLTLSSNLYLISKDKELMGTLTEYAQKGKDSWDKLMEDHAVDEYGEPVEDHVLKNLFEKAKAVKEELDQKMETVAVQVYEKLHITHTNEMNAMKEEVETLKRELALAEARILHLEEHKV